MCSSSAIPEAAVQSFRAAVTTYAGLTRIPRFRPTLPAEFVLKGQLPANKPLSPAVMHEFCARLSSLFIKSCLQEHCSYYWSALTFFAGLLQHSQASPFDFTDKYLGQGRPYSNSAFSANDLSYTNHRAQSSLTSGTSGVALPTNSNLDFNGNSLPTETP